MTIHHGDCFDVMPTLDANSIDAIVTDPPYGLEFMGKAWDKLNPYRRGNPAMNAAQKAERTPGGEFGDRIGIAFGTPTRIPRCKKCGKQKFNHPKSRCVCESPDWDMEGWHHNYGMQAWHEAWAREALRVAKPGAYLLAFGGTRTVHRLACAIEDAGWIIRDMLVWGYASGFPKGRANLKPAWEPIVMARKPGPLAMLNIDLCRMPFVDDEAPDDREGEATSETRYTLDGGTNIAAKPGRRITSHGSGSLAGPGAAQEVSRTEFVAQRSPLGRWPANIVLTDPIFDGDTPGVVGGGYTSSPATYFRQVAAPSPVYGEGLGTNAIGDEMPGYGDSGTYSRFFLIPKAARSDREPVLGGLAVNADKPLGALGNKFCTLCGESWVAADGWPKCGHGRENTGRRPALNPKARANGHPTVKPVDLMRHLVRLVTPPGGTVLDPFLGSGTTALAAEMEGFAWIGIEREAEYVAIAEARLNGTQRGMGLGA